MELGHSITDGALVGFVFARRAKTENLKAVVHEFIAVVVADSFLESFQVWPEKFKNGVTAQTD